MEPGASCAPGKRFTNKATAPFGRIQKEGKESAERDVTDHIPYAPEFLEHVPSVYTLIDLLRGKRQPTQLGVLGLDPCRA